MRAVVVLVCALAILSAPQANAGKCYHGIWEHAWSAESFRRAKAKDLRWADYRAHLHRLRLREY